MHWIRLMLDDISNHCNATYSPTNTHRAILFKLIYTSQCVVTFANVKAFMNSMLKEQTQALIKCKGQSHLIMRFWFFNNRLKMTLRNRQRFMIHMQNFSEFSQTVQVRTWCIHTYMHTSINYWYSSADFFLRAML